MPPAVYTHNPNIYHSLPLYYDLFLPQETKNYYHYIHGA